MAGGFGDNQAEHTIIDAAHSGERAARVNVERFSDGDAKWLQAFDLGECAPDVAEGRSYSLRSWYTSDSPTQFAVYLRDAQGAWRYWTSSPWFGTSDDFTQAVWTTPAIPQGMTGISFGLSLFSNGTLIIDNVEMYNAANAPAPAVDSRQVRTPKTAPPVSQKVEPQGVTEG